MLHFQLMWKENIFNADGSVSDFTSHVLFVLDLSSSGWMTNFKELLTICVIGMVLFWNGPVGIIHPAAVSESVVKQSVYR